MAWVGEDRPERRSIKGVPAILDFDDCGLVVGEGDRGGVDEYMGFGCPTTEDRRI